jgi:peptidase A4-like protein
MLRVRNHLRGTLATALVLLATIVPAGAAHASGAGARPSPPRPALVGPARGQAVGHTTAAAATVTNYTSRNWAGYFTTNAGHTTDFQGVHARWVQPRVTCPASGEAWMVAWVGMDGWWNDIVEQGGSSAYCFNGTAQYALWWEMWPHNLIQTANPINAGDTIDATVTYAAGAGTFSIVVRDVTNGQTLTQSQPCYSDMSGCPRVNAEVVTETPVRSDGSVFTLPGYGTLSYSSISATDTSGHTGPLTDSRWSLGRVNQVDPATGVTKQTTSATGQSGTSFATTWAHG